VLAIAATALLAGTGCSGINATRAVSPATFLLPGLMKADPPPAPPEATTPAEKEPVAVAQAR
jgi:hypothetical protein